MAENSPRNLRDRILDHLPININSDNVENQPLLGTGENNNNNDHVYWKKIKFYFVDLIFRLFKFIAITILLIIILFLIKNEANGNNAIIVSDHNTIEGGLVAQKIAKEKYNDKIIVIPAMEYTTCRIHMQFIGINETIPFFPPFPTDQDLKEKIDRVHQLG